MLVGSIKPDPNWESLTGPKISKCKKVQVLSSKNDLDSVKQTIASIIWSKRELIGKKGKQAPKGHILSASCGLVCLSLAQLSVPWAVPGKGTHTFLWNEMRAIL